MLQQGIFAVVEGSCITLGRAIELTNLRDVEPALELIPDLWAQAIPDGDADMVLLLGGTHWRLQEVPAEFPYVLDCSSIVFHAICEALAC